LYDGSIFRRGCPGAVADDRCDLRTDLNGGHLHDRETVGMDKQKQIKQKKMEALIFILGMVVLIESAAIVVFWNESTGKSRAIYQLRREIEAYKATISGQENLISDLKELIREMRKEKTNKN